MLLDPSLEELSDEQQRQMTHYPEPENPVPGMLGTARGALGTASDYWQKGLSANPTIQNWLNQIPGSQTLQGLLQSQTARDAFGTANTFIPPALLQMFNAAPLTAWHASPHEFPKFEYRPLTGEGAIGYGGGVYAAENPAVSGRGGFYDQMFVQRTLGRPLNRSERQILSSLDKGKSDQEIMSDLAARGYTVTARDVARINGVKSHVYKTIIDAHPGQMLDWDKPLNAQGPLVQNAARGLVPGVRDNMTGEQIYRALHDKYTRNGLSEHDAAEAIRQDLKGAGLVGTRYLDQLSRFRETDIEHYRSEIAAMRASGASGPQATAYLKRMEMALRELEYRKANATQNVVIFDPHIMRIAEKFGIAGILGGTWGLEEEGDAQNTQ